MLLFLPQSLNQKPFPLSPSSFYLLGFCCQNFLKAAFPFLILLFHGLFVAFILLFCTYITVLRTVLIEL